MWPKQAAAGEGSDADIFRVIRGKNLVPARTRYDTWSAFAKAGSGPELGTWRGFWLGTGKRLRRRRRSRTDFFWQRLIFQEQLQLHRVENFSFQQCGRDTLKSVAVVLQNGACTLVAGSHDAPDFLVNVNRCVFRIVAVLRDFAAEEDGFFLFAKGQRPERTHPPIADHFPGDLRGAFDVIACPRGDVPEEDLFGGAAAHQHDEGSCEIGLSVGVLVVDGKLHGQSERHAARDNRDL